MKVKKQRISIRIHPQVVKKLKLEAARQGIGYQTLAQAILATAVGGIR